MGRSASAGFRLPLLLLVLGAAALLPAASPPRDQPLPPAVQARTALSAVLGRPTAASVTLNLSASGALAGRIEVGPAGGPLVPGPGFRLAAGVPAEVELTGLKADTAYRYRVVPDPAGPAAVEGRFHTARAPGSAFTFDIIGDSHPERPQQFSPELYAKTLTGAASDAPDFFLTIGDDFSVDTLADVTKPAVEAIYARQRLYLSLVGDQAPVFLVNGNHEQASLANVRAAADPADNVAVWAQTARNARFPQPAPDGFYTGDAVPLAPVGLLRDYYAWTWGDALFVVIDPYWHSETAVDNAFGGGEKTRDLWQTTLGEAQYRWFRDTLAGSQAAYKFVFAHHVSGTGRGGIERAPYFEWGGKGASGKDEFAARRPGWEAPLHTLMARYKVTAFVQGHDHLFVRQELDGVTYLTLPEPADPNHNADNRDAFPHGDVLASSGRVRFSVAPDAVTVAYLRAEDGAEAYRFTLPASGPPTPGVFGVSLGPDTSPDPGPPAPKGGAKGTKEPKEAKEPKEPKEPRQTKDAPAAKGSPGPAASAAPASAFAADLTPAALAAGTLAEFPGPASVVLSSTLPADGERWYEYGPDGTGPWTGLKTTARTPAAGAAAVRDRIDGLAPGTAYRYRLAWVPRGETAVRYGVPGRFVTARAPGSAFTFAIEADPHFDENASPDGYRTTLARIAADRPDFLVDLGDTSMAEKLAADRAGYLARNLLVRSFWTGTGGLPPVFPVLGNHDGEHGWASRPGQPTSAEAAVLKKTWLQDPASAPAGPYSRFSDNAYSVTWGDALLVVLDPYAAEPRKPEGWDWTLGRAQYDWLASTLAGSAARWKFVFIHNLLGGNGKDGRGGADWAPFYEWGGKDPVGTDAFAARRPGWPLPVHGLLVKNRVTAVFHGHDHFAAHETLDGVAYQLVPQPSAAHPKALDPAEAAEFGYSAGVRFPAPGYVRVSVTPAACKIEVVAPDGTVREAY